jgi:hypothetical protein
MKKIKFRSEDVSIDWIKPEPSVKQIPQWFKDIPPIVNNNMTIKKCVPVLDALTTGYVFKTSADVYYDAELKRFTDNGVSEVVTYHADFQLDGWHYGDDVEPHPYKWINKFFLQTPKGYSTLFVHPLNRADLPFTSLSAVVDTDEFPLSVQFPFFIKKGFSGLIPAGTPIVQAIPIKRNDWKSDFGDEEESYAYKEFWKWSDPPFSKYKRKFWKRKLYS